MTLQELAAPYPAPTCDALMAMHWRAVGDAFDEQDDHALLFGGAESGGRAMQAKHISDDAFLDALDTTAERRWGDKTHGFVSRWDLATVLAGCPDDIRPGLGTTMFEHPQLPGKVLLAKARRLIRRGLISGCACGCRGDFSRATLEVSG